MHSVTASAVMTSLLAVSRRGYGWLADGILFSLQFFFVRFFYNLWQKIEETVVVWECCFLSGS